VIANSVFSSCQEAFAVLETGNQFVDFLLAFFGIFATPATALP